MRTQRQKFILILVTLALVISPLRAAFAMPMLPAADHGSHCEHMLDGSSSPAQMADMQASPADGSGHDCGKGCSGDCCDGACNTCVHSVIAIPGVITVNGAVQTNPPKTTISSGVTGQRVRPPFRPPIPLHS